MTLPTPDWQSDCGRVTLYCGDCLSILPHLEPGSVDAVVTDPPYCSGARTSAAISGAGDIGNKYARGARWAAKPLDCDQMTTVGFVWMMRELASACYPLLVKGGSFISFIDWRQYPNLYGAIESANYRIQAMVVWNKVAMALGNGFRKQHELAIHAAKGVPNVYDRSVPDVIDCSRISSSDLHPTEKPVDLIGRMVGVVTGRDGLVLDPFMGSGTTGVACVKTGRRFIGVELDRKYFEIAQRRIKEELEANLFLQGASHA